MGKHEPLFADTSPKAKEKLFELLRSKSVAEKLRMVEQLNASVRTLAISGLRRDYPDADEEEIRRRLADILLGPELALKVYGPLKTDNQDMK